MESQVDKRLKRRFDSSKVTSRNSSLNNSQTQPQPQQNYLSRMRHMKRNTPAQLKWNQIQEQKYSVEQPEILSIKSKVRHEPTIKKTNDIEM